MTKYNPGEDVRFGPAELAGSMSVDTVAAEPVVRVRRHTPEAARSTCGLYVEMLPDLDMRACFSASGPRTR